jgi:glycosyltransferase involved in cell wall biosynthesis
VRVSCICPTYNRVVSNKTLLEEALQCFLQQDYVDKELIIINDHSGQQIHFDHPDVVVINHPKRFATLGEKYNYAIEQCTGELICSWEDDDLSLPHRISLSVERIGDADYFNPHAYFCRSGGATTFDRGGYAHNCSMFRKTAWLKVGGYPLLSGPQDAAMDGLLRAQCKTIDGALTEAECFYLYRWGVSELHLSAFGDRTQQVYDEYALRCMVGGVFNLQPIQIRE